MKSRLLIAGAALAALAVPFATAQLGAQVAEVVAKARIGAWGFDATGQDKSVKPGDDFFRFVSGAWYDKAEIPADRPSLGTFYDLRETTQDQVKSLITAAPATSKVGAFYASFMDEKRLEAVGLAPLKRDVAAVNAIQTKAQFARYMGATNGRFGSSVIDMGVGADTANPEINVLYLGQGGIGLPEREYYFADQFKKQREAYKAYIVRTMKMLGNADPEKAADIIMGFEAEIAYKSWKIADRRQIEKVNNPMSSAELASYAPGLDWAQYFAGAKVPAQKRLIVGENTAVKAIAQIYAQTPLSTLKLWQTFHVADQAAPYLNKAMVDNRFEYTKTLSGVAVNRERWKRGVDLVGGQLGELVGQEYVAKFFPPSSKAKMEVLVANLKVAMASRIKSNSWMSDTTKAAALEKLSKMEVMVGYPDKWRSYAGLNIVAGDLYGNVQRAGQFNAAYNMADLGKKVDRKKWGMNPQTVNAYNGGLENKIVFPAGILQAPFFDPNADDAVNYGAIGGVIGHEIIHGFDDQGRKIDATGAVRDWWTAEDAKRFEEQAKIFGAQYAAFEVVPGAFINPDLTMGENIADLGGISIALDAYRTALGGKDAPVLDGMSGEQRVLLAWAQVWRAKARETSLRNQVATDPHSPAQYRAFAPLRNVDTWYAAFNVQPGDKLYIAPDKRARLW
ncbi:MULTISPECIES: M13 family metallopeptidase [unclassified Novosphingobium]|uniref:M13 family metallopeptidase n=1 Tax=unclassified Novosphingobium TaxID=2644732 RepID=UPI0025DB210C|nr:MULTISPECIES: M13 family metallopeptidase [unclassified Novosphingobium]HQV04757.1 M13 family metallopeptidase [Novosphingobium sp.]